MGRWSGRWKKGWASRRDALELRVDPEQARIVAAGEIAGGFDLDGHQGAAVIGGDNTRQIGDADEGLVEGRPAIGDIEDDLPFRWRIREDDGERAIVVE